MQLASLINKEKFADMTTEDEDELIDCHSEPLNEQDLEAMTKSASKKEEKESHEQAVEQSRWLLKRLVELFGLINKVKERSQECYDGMVWSVQLCIKADELMNPYKMILIGKRGRDSNFP